MATIAKTKISQLATLPAATATTVIPVSDGTGTITTYKITPDNLIKDTAAIAAKADKIGNNVFIGDQSVTGTVYITGSLASTGDVAFSGDLGLVKGRAIEFTDETSMPISKLYFLNNVTSDVQTQLNSKVDTATHGLALSFKANTASPSLTGTTTATAINVTNLTMFDGIVSGSISVPEGTLAQHAVRKSQLDLKANLTGNNVFEGDQVFDDNVEIKGSLTVLGEISLPTVTNNEIRTLEGIEGNVQVQLDGKPDLGSPNQFSASNIFNAGIVVGSGLVSNGVTYINGTLMAGDTLIMNEQLKTLYGIRIGTGVTIQSQFDSLYYTADDLATNKVDGTERHLHVKLSQTGTNPPTMTILKNTAMPGITLTPIRTGTGGYAIVRGDAQPITGVVTCNKHNIVLRNLEKNMVIETSVNGTQLIIETVDLTEPSTYADNLLSTVLEFTFYNS